MGKTANEKPYKSAERVVDSDSSDGESTSTPPRERTQSLPAKARSSAKAQSLVQSANKVATQLNRSVRSHPN
jgi:hypothetical protein